MEKNFSKWLRVNLLLILIIALAGFLRIWGIEKNPVSLFGDELDVGYHAYSILKTGKDYSGNFLPLHFHSLAEWRTPLYLYASVPTVAFFGITPMGVRLPAVAFGILGIYIFYLLINYLTKNKKLALLSTLLLSISPWHLQYSRAGFEVTMMLAFYLAGIYFFIKSFSKGESLLFSALFLGLTPWVYSTAKFYLPLTLFGILIIWGKDILNIPKKYLFWGICTFIIVIIPITWSTLFGGGLQRFGYISVFTDPTIIPQVGFDRLNDARIRGESGVGIQPILQDRIFHNKFLSWFAVLGRNYLQSFSTNFLFINGDLNLRHSIRGFGQFYKFEAVFFLLGLYYFVSRNNGMENKTRKFIFFWLLSAPIPAALTRDGGMHATRLFFLLPPLIFLISLGIYNIANLFSKKTKILFYFCYSFVLIISFIFYYHNYWSHYPWESERWWHAGFYEATRYLREVDKNFEKVIITSANEPPWIFFAAGYEYPPEKWQKDPLKNKVNLPGFGEVSYIDKFYFGSPNKDLYTLSEVLDEKTLYLASEKEIKVNLVLEPERKPQNLELIKTFVYPSGEPAYYLFTKK